MMENQILDLPEKKILKSDFGPVSFGLIISGIVVPWSGENSKDLLIGSCWKGIYLYPSKSLEDIELSVEPIKISPPLSWTPSVASIDWNKDGHDDLIVANRTGFLYYFERKGEYPDLFFNLAGMVKDEEKNLLFNVPYENSSHPIMNDLDGYQDSDFLNYPFPILYPLSVGNNANLIIGDWSGNLWWLPDSAEGAGKPVYRGIEYIKDKSHLVSEEGKKFIEQYGCVYVKPEEKICDEDGNPFILGDGHDTGVDYEGCNTRPALYRNDLTGSADLVVLAGGLHQKLYYLQRINVEKNGKPAFTNLGEIDLKGIFEPFQIWYYHSKVIVYNNNGWNDLLISLKSEIAVFKNKRSNTIKPEFQFSHLISKKDATTCGNNFTEILNEVKTRKKYILDNCVNNKWELREIRKLNGEVRLSSDKITLNDQNGVFSVEGETDPQGGKDYFGFNRAYRWDFDKSGKQHLIVGTDKGLFFLLVEVTDSNADGRLMFKSVGPLKDCNGNIIRIHSRSCACGIDLNGDGIEDLILGGVSYQLGIKTDPDPGGGFYYILNKGLDEKGLPMLGYVQPLQIKGCTYDFKINTHIHLQAIDLDKDGDKEVILSNQTDDFKGRVFKTLKNSIGLQYTGKYLKQLSIVENLLDIDEDGQLEIIISGGEEGVGYYQKIIEINGV